MKQNHHNEGAQIALENVSKVYNAQESTAVQALKDVSLEIQQGEFVSIVGASGSGKSTLMRVIGCLEQPSQGEYRFAGVSISRCGSKELSKIRRDRIVTIPQHYNLNPAQSVLENVAAPLRSNGVSPARKRHRAEQALRFVGLEGKGRFSPDQLSGGQQQRVAIARALVTQPEIILADEPTAALDMETKELVFRLFEKLNRDGITVILITHDISLAYRAQRMVTVRGGTVTEDRFLAQAG